MYRPFMVVLLLVTLGSMPNGIGASTVPWKQAVAKLSIEVDFDASCFAPNDQVDATVILHNPTDEPLYIATGINGNVFLVFKDECGKQIAVRGHTIYSISVIMAARRKDLVSIPAHGSRTDRVSVPLKPFLFPEAGWYRAQLGFDGPVTGGNLSAPRKKWFGNLLEWDYALANTRCAEVDIQIVGRSEPDSDMPPN